MGLERRSGASEPEYAGMGDRLRQARRARGLSLRRLAEVVGVSPSLISQVETGRAKPSVNTLYALANELGVSLDVLLFMDTQPPVEDGGRGAPSWPRRATSISRTIPCSAPPRDPASASVRGVVWERLTTGVDPERGLPPRDLRGRQRVEPGARPSSGTPARSGATS